MSHFSVTVCLPATTELDKVEQVLEEVMAPWDENRDVEPYRDYEDGSAGEFWWVRAVRRGAEHHRNGTGEANKRAEYADDAMWAQRLGENPTWADVAACYNEKWHPENASF